MKTYVDYVEEWNNSTESRDLSFDEWLTYKLSTRDLRIKEYLEKISKEERRKSRTEGREHCRIVAQEKRLLLNKIINELFGE